MAARERRFYARRLGRGFRRRYKCAGTVRSALGCFDFGAGVMPLFLQELASGAQIAGHPPEAA
jgi:hypothetical protein